MDTRIKKKALRIRLLMLRKGVSGSAIARAEGVDRTAIYKTIDGKIRSHRLQLAISKALGLTPERHEKLWGKKEAA